MKDRRKLSRRLLAILPEKLRHSLMRNQVRINPEWPSDSLEIKIADTEEELASAYRLLHDSYVSSGFMNPDPTGMRVLPQHLLPQTTTIVAKWDGRVIGTLSLIRDNAFGLPLEKIFDIGDRRFNGRRLAEVSSLAVDPLYRGQINKALFPLFRFVYQYARDCFGIHEFVIAVNPSTVDLYLGFICFEKLKAKPRSYEFVKGAPAVGLYLNFETVLPRWKNLFGQRPTSSNFFKYWTEIPTSPKNQMPKRRYHSSSDPILTPKLLVDFFINRARLGERLTYKEIQTLLNVYPFPEFQKALQPIADRLSRKHVRLETQMKAQWSSNQGESRVPSEVMNVSMEGLLLRTEPGSLSIGKEIQVQVWLNETASTTLSAEVRWSPPSGLVGVRILNATFEWLRMVDTLEKEYHKQSIEDRPALAG